MEGFLYMKQSDDNAFQEQVIDVWDSRVRQVTKNGMTITLWKSESGEFRVNILSQKDRSEKDFFYNSLFRANKSFDLFLKTVAKGFRHGSSS